MVYILDTITFMNEDMHFHWPGHAIDKRVWFVLLICQVMTSISWRLVSIDLANKNYYFSMSDGNKHDFMRIILSV